MAADVAEAIAAAMAAVAPPGSPCIKSEPPAADSMAMDLNPVLERPQSPLKRPRTPDEDGGERSRDEKRLKVEDEGPEAGLGDMDEIARLVQQAEASVMRQFRPVPDSVDGLPTSDIEGVHGLPVLQPPFDPRAPTQMENTEPRSESLWSNPRDFTRRKHIIPALGSLAVDIIAAWSEQSLEDTIATLCGEGDSDIAKEYAALKAAFDSQRRLLSDAHPLLYPEQLNLANQSRQIIRVVNLATVCASVFGTNELGLEEINDHFLRIFVPENQEVPRDVAELYLGLKTQIFIAVLECEQGKAREQSLDDLFLTSLESSLQGHHPRLPLTAAEREFVASAEARRAMLSNESADIDSIQALSKQFTYEAFLDSLSTFLNDHIESIRAESAGKVDITTVTEDTAHDEHIATGVDGTFDINAMIAEASRAAQRALEPAGEAPNELDDLSAFLAENVSKAVEQAKETTSTELPSAIASAAESASRATMLALQSIQQNQYQPTALPQSNAQTHPNSNHNHCQPAQQTPPQQQYSHYQQHSVANGLPLYHTAGHLPPNQSDSTPALYERARQAAAARSSTHARREGSHSTRRPWSPEEEKALMMGLDMVKGPHWSQILSLFGPNGSISNILADRTQVQLKDKARNLKLFFLKTNSEMPYYLQCVTGELKTRAPTQAARKEAEEKARLNSEEQQAHVNGILTLAGGLQNNAAASRQDASPTTVPRSATPSQPLSRPTSHPSSQPGTPGIPQPPIQPSAPAPAPTSTPLPRPVIPAPQPVSLPNLTSISHQHMQPPSISQAEQQAATAPIANPPATSNIASTSGAKALPEALPETASGTPPLAEDCEPTVELSSVDAAVLGLKAALETERKDSATAYAPSTSAINGEIAIPPDTPDALATNTATLP
ncbi:telomere repeat binding factor-domain-containing protein [Durotheca rogersii]|uniref:telomere repeat binding factor-domain-containing protein n=1 Tax=Durotheca rogersii TaxID=419775 RepID=UPI00221E5C92|nr:telomere repeat binding factor-domain-containing protein [Durotheca rogersii]KAI5864450.1 telomere repeat binding factor-domain-containing protein [Durotheca rogersii]